PNPVIAFLHHEIQISTAGAIWMEGAVIALGPLRNLLAICGIGVDPDNHLAPDGIAITERRLSFADAVHFSIHRIKVHGRLPGGQKRGVLEMLCNRSVADLTEEVGL